jgi:hypothetical protein
VTALDGRRDHRAPAAGRGVGDDVAAVADRPHHLGAGSDDAVAEPVHEDRLGGAGGRLVDVHGHGAPPGCGSGGRCDDRNTAPGARAARAGGPGALPHAALLR